MQLESTAKYSEYYYSLDDTAKQRYKVKLELVGALDTVQKTGYTLSYILRIFRIYTSRIPLAE